MSAPRGGGDLSFSPQTLEKISELAQSLAGDMTANDAVSSLCAVCKGIQSSGQLCSEHQQKKDTCTYCLKNAMI